MSCKRKQEKDQRYGILIDDACEAKMLSDDFATSETALKIIQALYFGKTGKLLAND